MVYFIISSLFRRSTESARGGGVVAISRKLVYLSRQFCERIIKGG
jgi:hypothetical protein